MRGLVSSSLLLAAASLMAQSPVSVYQFNGDLFPSFTNGRAGVLEKRIKTIAPDGPFPTVTTASTFTSVSDFGAPRNVATFLRDEDNLAATGQNSGFFRVFSGMPNNGGGFYGNQFAIVMDMRIDELDPTANRWFSLFNTTADAGNDGDTFFDLSRGFGISGVYAGLPFALNTFARIAIVIDLTRPSGTSATPIADRRLQIFVNGTLVNGVNISGLNGRWAIYGWETGPTDGYTHYDIFADDSGEMGSGAIAQLATYASALTASEVAALGAVGTSLVPSAQNLLKGKLDFGTYNGNVDGGTPGIERPIAAQVDMVLFDTAGTVVETFNSVQINAFGEFCLPIATPGSYMLGVKASTWRAINQTASTDTTFLNSKFPVTVPAGGAVNTFFLKNGDANRDGEIGPADFSEVLAYFGSEFGDGTYILNADIDKNGEIGPADFSIVLDSFGAEADF